MINGESADINMNIKVKEDSNINTYNILKRAIDIISALIRYNNFVSTYCNCFYCE